MIVGLTFAVITIPACYRSDVFIYQFLTKYSWLGSKSIGC